jgi:hypothetical protein
MRTFAPAVVLVAIAIGAPLVQRAVAASNPVVTGPLTGTTPGDPSHDYPFHAAALEDLEAHSYVEQEFFIAGEANRYHTEDEANATVIDGNHHYQTRLVVHRPTSAARFNGTVIIEWNNVTAGYDIEGAWYQSYDYFMRAGFVWIGVSPQRVGVEALKRWNPRRYGMLDVTADGTIMNDDLSYDIFADVGRVVRKPVAVDVLGGLKAQRVFATGWSQSGGRLATYVNSLHQPAPVFDAVVLHNAGNRFPIRSDVSIKVWKLLSETDVITGAAGRQPDANNLRTWEVAGASHVDAHLMASGGPVDARDGRPVPPSPAPPSEEKCGRPPFSHVPLYQVMDAVFDHLVGWVKDGTAPPSAPPIEVASIGPPAVLARDKMGNASGGIRLAEIAVPAAVNTGQNSGTGFCRLEGSHEDFDAATAASLYPSHTAYVAAVKDVTEKNVKAGYILKPEADATIAAAERSTLGLRR